MLVVEIKVESTLSTADIIAALINQGDFGDYFLYEQGDKVHFAAAPLWELQITEADENPWEKIAVATKNNGFTEYPLYGWIAFELASKENINFDRRSSNSGQLEPRNSALAKFFVPGIEVQCSNQAITIRAHDKITLDRIRGIIATATPYSPGAPHKIDITKIDEAYLRSVANAVTEIEAGTLQKVILSRVIDVPFKVSIFDTYIRGRESNTPARSFLVKLDGWEIAGFSPETVAEVSADGRVSTQPLAGTRALTGDEKLDAALRKELMQDPKEIFEHAVSVQLAYKELETVADTQGPWISEFMAIKPRGSVQHLGSRVSCQLAEDKTHWDALQALFPAITASGIPKIPAYRVIREQESTARMLYSGAIVRCDSDGSLDAALVLRSVYKRNDRAWLRAGAGIVQGSRPEREHEETCEKLSSVAPYLVPVQEQSQK